MTWNSPGRSWAPVNEHTPFLVPCCSSIINCVSNSLSCLSRQHSRPSNTRSEPNLQNQQLLRIESRPFSVFKQLRRSLNNRQAWLRPILQWNSTRPTIRSSRGCTVWMEDITFRSWRTGRWLELERKTSTVSSACVCHDSHCVMITRFSADAVTAVYGAKHDCSALMLSDPELNHYNEVQIIIA